MQGKTILVVDDDPDLLKLVSIRLKTKKFKVLTAESGDKALALLATTRPDLVVTDLQMDKMDGLQLFEQIHTDHPALPVIILTAHGTIPDAVSATKRGVFGFLSKPFDYRELLEQIEAALSQSGATTADLSDDEWSEAILTRNPKMRELLSQAHLAALSEASVFIHGESGTGKELLAQAIHRASRRKDHPFVALNCGAIPESLLESELFGHTKGSFTGAVDNYDGMVRGAHKGTLFLDEIGDMPLQLQVKLLRVLQERQVRPLGSTRSIPVDVRIISATHRDLQEEIRAGRFREDLYYRLNVIPLALPNLSERREDIPLLANHFLAEFAGVNGKKVTAFAPKAMEYLIGASWPGNVRQLRNVVEQAVVLSTSSLIPPQLVKNALRDVQSEIPSYADARQRFDRNYFAQLLKATSGNVTRAANLAGRNRTEFYKLLQRYELNPADFRAD